LDLREGNLLMLADDNLVTTTTPLHHRWPFAAVLVATLLLVVAQPLLSAFFGEDRSFDVFFSILLLAVLSVVFEQRRHRRIAFSFGLLALVGVWISRGFSTPTHQFLLVGAHMAAAVFFVFALLGILRGVFAKRVSGDAIFGAACGYLLLGIIWSLLYSAVESLFPGSLHLAATEGSISQPMQIDRGMFNYYSFITLATVGYGDVTPTSPVARTLACAEAVVGQFYLAVLVAGLVGFKVTEKKKDPVLTGGR